MKSLFISLLVMIFLAGAGVGYASDVTGGPDGPKKAPTELIAMATPQPMLQAEPSVEELGEGLRQAGDALRDSSTTTEEIGQWTEDIGELLQILGPKIAELDTSSPAALIGGIIGILMVIVTWLLATVRARTSKPNLKRIVREAIREEKNASG